MRLKPPNAPKFPKPPKFSTPNIKIKRPNSDTFLESVAYYLAIPFFIVEFFRRHDTLRKWLLRLFLFAGFSYLVFGPNSLTFIMSIGMLAMNLLYAIGFMMIQFVGLFWFMSRTRLTEVHPGDPKNVTFDDYWGQEHLVTRVRHWTKILSNRKQFEGMGGRTLNGMLLLGPPGTGKTLLAKAMAGDGAVAFLGTEGSSFRAMFWGVDTLKTIAFVSRARKLARRFGACIAYIDEIDAIAMSRSGVMGTQGQGQVQGVGPMGMGNVMSGALTRLLYEMDGLDETPAFDVAQNKARRLFGLPMIDPGKVMFMGATNRPDVLDPAILRPGRFDQQIVVNIPDEGSRRKIFKGYLGKIKASPDINIESLIQDTPGVTPAHIMSVVTKDAVRNALFNDRDIVTQEDIELALQEKLIGIQNPIEGWEPEQKRAVAAHEAGHAIVARVVRPHKRIVRASIIRRGLALGYMLDVNPKDVYAHPQKNWTQDIMVGLAGNIGTKLVMGEYWTGMGGDMMKIRQLVQSLMVHGAFDSYSFLLSSGGTPDEELNKAVDQFMRNCHATVELILEERLPALIALTDELVAKEDLTGEQAIAIIEQSSQKVVGKWTSEQRERGI